MVFGRQATCLLCCLSGSAWSWSYWVQLPPLLLMRHCTGISLFGCHEDGRKRGFCKILNSLGSTQWEVNLLVALISKWIFSDDFKMKLREKNEACLKTLFRKVICDHCFIALTVSKYYIRNLLSLWENYIGRETMNLSFVSIWLLKKSPSGSLTYVPEKGNFRVLWSP